MRAKLMIGRLRMETRHDEVGRVASRRQECAVRAPKITAAEGRERITLLAIGTARMEMAQLEALMMAGPPPRFLTRRWMQRFGELANAMGAAQQLPRLAQLAEPHLSSNAR